MLRFHFSFHRSLCLWAAVSQWLSLVIHPARQLKWQCYLNVNAASHLLALLFSSSKGDRGGGGGGRRKEHGALLLPIDWWCSVMRVMSSSSCYSNIAVSVMMMWRLTIDDWRLTIHVDCCLMMTLGVIITFIMPWFPISFLTRKRIISMRFEFWKHCSRAYLDLYRFIYNNMWVK